MRDKELIETIKRILVFGENLYLKAIHQEFHLQSSNAEIKHIENLKKDFQE